MVMGNIMNQFQYFMSTYLYILRVGYSLRKKGTKDVTWAFLYYSTIIVQMLPKWHILVGHLPSDRFVSFFESVAV